MGNQKGRGAQSLTKEGSEVVAITERGEQNEAKREQRGNCIGREDGGDGAGFSGVPDGELSDMHLNLMIFVGSSRDNVPTNAV